MAENFASMILLRNFAPTSTRGAESSAEIIPIEPDTGNADAGNLILHSQKPLLYAATAIG